MSADEPLFDFSPKPTYSMQSKIPVDEASLEEFASRGTDYNNGNDSIHQDTLCGDGLAAAIIDDFYASTELTGTGVDTKAQWLAT